MSSTLRKKEDSSIDIVKFISSFLIVSIHSSPFEDYSATFNYYFENVFARIAVCLFFVITGYYFFKGIDFENGKIKKSKENKQRLFKYVSRILILYVVWSLIYLVWMIPEWYNTGWLSLMAFIDFGISFLLNSGYYHLWFLLGLIYAIPIMYFLLRFIRLKYFVVLSFLIYIFGMLSNTYSFIGLPTNKYIQMLYESVPILNTVIFVVIPLLCISIITQKINLPSRVYGVLSVLFLILYSCEAMYLYGITKGEGSYTYIIVFTIPATLFAFLFLKSLKCNINNGYFLRKTSTLIYCVHPLIINIIHLCFGENTLNSTLEYLIVAILSMLLSALIFCLYKKFKFCKFLKYFM